MWSMVLNMEHRYILEPGTILSGKYVIESVIGQGGMSNVYLARDVRLGKRWAVKEISPYTCHNYSQVSETLISEAEILTRLDHPSLPRIVDIFFFFFSLIIAMDYIRGRNLSDLLRDRGLFDESQVVRWGIELAGVLSYLHSQKPPIIYRDMKPSNIMIKEDGKLMLIDFGTAREYSETGSEDTLCLGTRGYAAPEQYGGSGQSDVRTDIYGLGVTLYHLLTGRDPSKPPYAILPVRQLIPHVSPGMEAVIARSTNPDPADRFSDMEDLAYSLCHVEEAGKDFLRKEKRKMMAAALLWGAALLSFLVGAFLSRAESNCRKSLVDYYIRQASCAQEEKERYQWFSTALMAMPDQALLYQAILDSYWKEGDFGSREEASVISLTSLQTEGGTCLDLFRKKDVRAYCDFCFSVGLACFFDLGGRRGKCEARPWFAAVEKYGGPGFDRGKKERAILYGRISDYYREYIDKGDRTGETEKSYSRLFTILQELNEIDITAEDDDAKIAAAFYISKEVLMEIVSYADRFAKEEIPVGRMRSQIRRISRAPSLKGRSRADIFKLRRPGKDYRQISDLIEDAERKLDMEVRKEDRSCTQNLKNRWTRQLFFLSGQKVGA